MLISGLDVQEQATVPTDSKLQTQRLKDSRKNWVGRQSDRGIACSNLWDSPKRMITGSHMYRQILVTPQSKSYTIQSSKVVKTKGHALLPKRSVWMIVAKHQQEKAQANHHRNSRHKEAVYSCPQQKRIDSPTKLQVRSKCHKQLAEPAHDAMVARLLQKV